VKIPVTTSGFPDQMLDPSVGKRNKSHVRPDA
jgi:hypothetical protein